MNYTVEICIWRNRKSNHDLLDQFQNYNCYITQVDIKSMRARKRLLFYPSFLPDLLAKAFNYKKYCTI